MYFRLSTQTPVALILWVMVFFSSGDAFARVRVDLQPSAKYYMQYDALKQTRTLDVLASEILDRSNLVPDYVSLVISARECGAVNAFYNPSRKEIVLCYEYLHQVENYFADYYKRQPLSTQVQSSFGVLVYVFLHELAHALIDVNNVPVLGREEDAADGFSAYMLIEYAMRNAASGKQLLRGVLRYNWATKTHFLDKLLDGKSLYADEHALNEQRVFNIVCLAYGASPGVFRDVVLEFGLSNERAARCGGEYAKTKIAVNKLFNLHAVVTSEGGGNYTTSPIEITAKKAAYGNNCAVSSYTKVEPPIQYNSAFDFNCNDGRILRILCDNTRCFLM